MLLQEKMTSTELRSVITLALIMTLRMLGLFMVLPVFSLYAEKLTGATPLLMGIAIGIYGLSQAIFQIPFGAWSDRFGRKPLILIGLVIFALGSLIAANADSIFIMILGRTLQGVGAIGSTILATIADLTREEQRTKAMAIAGISIGFSFLFAILLGPILTAWLNVSGLFYLAVILSVLAIFILFLFVPAPPRSQSARTLTATRLNKNTIAPVFNLLLIPELARLNIGIFILHAIFTANFVVLPILLYQMAALPTSHQWLIYLPTLLIAFLMSFIGMIRAEKNQSVKFYFLGSIAVILLSQLLFLLTPHTFTLIFINMSLFFTGFSLLEALLPSLISRTAPTNARGTALGIYSCLQFLGIFAGGVLGGWLYGRFSFSGVYFLCVVLVFFWIILAYRMQSPSYFVTHIVRLSKTQQQEWHTIAAKLCLIPGMIDATLVVSENAAHLRMKRETMQHPDFIRFKEQLQSE